jgi:hypothetical protein
MSQVRSIEDQLAAIDAGGPPQSSVVVLRNLTSLVRQATIVAAGVHFHYQDGTDHMVGPVDISLPSGQTAPFTSSDPRKCVIAFTIAVSVRFGSEGGRDGMAQPKNPRSSRSRFQIERLMGISSSSALSSSESDPTLASMPPTLLRGVNSHW